MDKKTTQCIKGLAILIMISFHFCLYLNMLIQNVGTEFIVKFWGSVGKICVAIYAVLSGYGYYFAKDKSVKYGLKKIWGLLQIYWLSLFTIFIPISIGGGVEVYPYNAVCPTIWIAP